MERFLKLSASVFDSTDLVTNPANAAACRIYLWLLHLANWHGTFTKTIKGQTVVLKEGECACSRKLIASALKLSESETRYAINRLQKMQLIGVKPTKNFTVFSIGCIQTQPTVNPQLTHGQPTVNPQSTNSQPTLDPQSTIYLDDRRKMKDEDEDEREEKALEPVAVAPSESVADAPSSSAASPSPSPEKAEAVAQPKKEPKPKKPQRPVKENPPTEDAVAKYIVQKGFNYVDPHKFHSYYTKMRWRKVNGQDVYNWKSTAKNWQMREEARLSPTRKHPEPNPEDDPLLFNYVNGKWVKVDTPQDVMEYLEEQEAHARQLAEWRRQSLYQ